MNFFDLVTLIALCVCVVYYFLILKDLKELRYKIADLIFYIKTLGDDIPEELKNKLLSDFYEE